MSNIAVIGAGYVGLVTGVCFAEMGNQTVCVDVDVMKTAELRRGNSPIYEPGLDELLARNLEAGRVRFTSRYEDAIPDADLVFIAVGTPSGATGEADIAFVEEAARSIAEAMRKPLVIVNKSTVPIGTGDLVSQIIVENQPSPLPFSVVSNPEFLREGSAVHDFFGPDRVVLGSSDPEAAEFVSELYKPLNCPILITDLRTAEMIKYASNAFLATKISFINEIASICEKLGADVKVVAQGMGMDSRVGATFLDAGVGWGGSCFPKDVKALIQMGATTGCHPQLLRSVVEINDHQRRQVLLKLQHALGTVRDKEIGILGLAFKPNTDDMREAPSIDIVNLLAARGARVRGYDPVAMETAERLLGKKIRLCESALDLADGADALVVVTAWNEFKLLDMQAVRRRMSRPVLIDGRNIYDPDRMREIGFIYSGIGRGYGGRSQSPLDERLDQLDSQLSHIGRAA